MSGFPGFPGMPGAGATLGEVGSGPVSMDQLQAFLRGMGSQGVSPMAFGGGNGGAASPQPIVDGFVVAPTDVNYDSSLFTFEPAIQEHVQKEISCPRCTKVMREPVALSVCDHGMCKLCFELDEVVDCSSCSKEINGATVDYHLQVRLESLPVRCNACSTWTGELRMLHQHKSSECGVAPAPASAAASSSSPEQGKEEEQSVA